MNSEYVIYKNTIRSLQGILGLTCMDFWDTEKLHPYVLAVLEYLNEQLVLAAPDSIISGIKKFCSIVDLGNECLLETDLEDLYVLMGLTDRPDTWEDTLFCVAWTNICTTLWSSIKCNYASVLWELEHQSCECMCDCSGEIEQDDNLYSKLVGNCSSITTGISVGPKLSGCGCHS